MLHNEFLSLVEHSPEANIRLQSLMTSLAEIKQRIDEIEGMTSPSEEPVTFSPSLYTDLTREISILSQTLTKNLRSVYQYTISNQPKAEK